MLSEVRRHVAVATLNRPRALNALNTGMVESMFELYSAWEADPGVACILLKASAPPHVAPMPWSACARQPGVTCSMLVPSLRYAVRLGVRHPARPLRNVFGASPVVLSAPARENAAVLPCNYGMLGLLPGGAVQARQHPRAAHPVSLPSRALRPMRRAPARRHSALAGT